jgi:hypothetical protein
MSCAAASKNVAFGNSDGTPIAKPAVIPTLTGNENRPSATPPSYYRR